MAAVLYVYNWMPWIAFLWHNLMLALVVVVAVGMANQLPPEPGRQTRVALAAGREAEGGYDPW